jgi:hypothetical protein
MSDMTPTLLPSLPPEGALCSGPAEPDPRKRLEGAWPLAGLDDARRCPSRGVSPDVDGPVAITMEH